jgi:hypothetical protein
MLATTKRTFIALGAVVLAAGLATAAPKCSPFRGAARGCKNEIRACVVSCRDTGTAKECRRCRAMCRREIPKTCQSTAGTLCASPSGAFVG